MSSPKWAPFLTVQCLCSSSGWWVRSVCICKRKHWFRKELKHFNIHYLIWNKTLPSTLSLWLHGHIAIDSSVYCTTSSAPDPDDQKKSHHESHEVSNRQVHLRHERLGCYSREISLELHTIPTHPPPPPITTTTTHVLLCCQIFQ